ncbi:MAG: rhodanese-like domain-containing protein [Gammaproteobacteria bacterium]|nr:rhodanese-like domain-containing protein [Gammaproteobacteria bacterium]
MSQVKSISAKAAYDLLENNPQAILVDVRSSMEFLFVGHPKGSVNLPWIDEPDWVVDPHFTAHVRQLMLGGIVCDGEGCVPVLLICRSGKRSLEAGKKLIEDGFTEVFNIEGGFEGPLDESHHRSSISGWRFEGLPWEQC